MAIKNLIVILGAGGCARELYWNIHDFYKSHNLSDTQIVFVDDISERLELVTGRKVVPIVKNWDFSAYQKRIKNAGFYCGIASPNGKKQMVARALAAGLAPLPTLVHPRAVVQGIDSTLGFGGYIAPGCVLTVNIQLGDYVLLNYNCTVGHDAKIGNFSTCNPGCHVSGNVNLGDGVMLGAGTFVLENLKIPAGTVAGAQSCIIHSIEGEGTTVVGVPAKCIKKPRANN
ncbi:MAG: acetyltransferase [Candidatus Omnitrophica bacterium]|nr:acetyltransferase [Candidatus Omnitrophota bacterium]